MNDGSRPFSLMEDLPLEITTLIIDTLPLHDLGTVATTSHKWNKLCVDMLKRKVAKEVRKILLRLVDVRIGREFNFRL
jgi:hypothetical protein